MIKKLIYVTPSIQLDTVVLVQMVTKAMVSTPLVDVPISMNVLSQEIVIFD